MARRPHPESGRKAEGRDGFVIVAVLWLLAAFTSKQDPALRKIVEIVCS